MSNTVTTETLPEYKIAIGICTFRRPVGLDNALSAIINQTYSRITPPALQIFVIDNDSDPVIEHYVEDFAKKYNVAIKYIAESRRGISQARNCFLRNIPAESELVVFLDDDEVPVDNWLDELVFGLHQSGADAISGPVLPIFSDQTPKWLVDGKFFTSPRRKNVPDYGSVVFGVMGNFLMRRNLIENTQLYFPEELGLVGSEDRHFFDILLGMGAKMSWSSNAIASHFVPTERASLRYLLKREFRVGCGKSLVLRLSEARTPQIVSRATNDFIRFIIKLVIALPTCLIGLTSSNHYDRVKPLFDVWQYAGRLYGLMGLRYQQYK